MTGEDGAAPQRALVVMAHPDDVDFGAAGTIAAWQVAGTEVAYCIVTDGDAGGVDRTISRSEMAETRRREQRAAAAAVGVTDVRFLGHPDGRLVVDLPLRRDISRVIRQTRPDVVLCQSPTRNLDRIQASHPDHLAAGEATLCAVYPDARNPFAHPELLADEGLEPHAVGKVWLAGHPEANRTVDVTEHFDAKLAALRSHASQMPNVPGGDPETLLRQWMAWTAMSGGLAEGRLAESFRVLDTA